MIVKEKEMSWREWLNYLAAEREFDKLHGPRQYKRVQLPESEWHKCTRCDGTRSYLMGGDAHRSPGIVPCGCGDGIIREKIVEVKRRVRIQAKSEKC
jgi:hypothetical protein